MSNASVIRKVLYSLMVVGIGLTTTLVAGTVRPRVANAASISNVSFKAPVHDSYDHETGGGAWNTGSTDYVKGELQATNYACGEYASFMVLIEVPATPDITTGLKARVSVDFTLDSTGQSGVALIPDHSAEHLAVNYPLVDGTVVTGDSDYVGLAPLDGGFVPDATTPAAVISRSTSGGLVADDPDITYYKGTWPGTPATLFESGADARLEFTVLNLYPTPGQATKTVIRMDALIECDPDASPTGNLQAALMSVIASGDTAGPETISGGNQTVNFRGVGQLAGLAVQTAEPGSLEVKKSVADGDIDCPGTYSGVNELLFSGVSRTVTYCYYVTNNSSLPAIDLELVDDKNPAGATTPLTLDGLYDATTLQGDAAGDSLVDDLEAGETATAEMVVTLAGAQNHVNVATATGTIDGEELTATDSASVVIQRALVGRLSVVKTQTSPSPVKVGDVVTYQIVVTNVGEGALDNVTVTDPNATLGTCTPVNPAPQLRVNDKITCTATHVVTAADESAGKVLNTAYATGKNGGVTIPQASSLVVETPVVKAAVPTTTVPAGGAKGTGGKSDTGTNRAGDQAPGTLPGTGYDSSGLVLAVWLLVFGSLAIIWSDRRRRI